VVGPFGAGSFEPSKRAAEFLRLARPFAVLGVAARFFMSAFHSLLGGFFASDKCCATYEIPTNRSGRQETPSVGGGSRVHESFDMLAHFRAGGDCACKCCEYRQFVRGEFIVDGNPQRHILPDGDLDRTIWREDGMPHHYGAGKHLFYGHRTDPGMGNDVYTPRRADGCEYRGHDDPGARTGNATAHVVVRLQFRGEILDTCNNTRQSVEWRVDLTRP
jgi:hypothetical protein